jgi:hypothetical protein
MNMRRVVLSVVVIVLVLAGERAGAARPVPDDAGDMAAADAQILSEIRDHSEALVNLEYLSDEIIRSRSLRRDGRRALTERCAGR